MKLNNLFYKLVILILSGMLIFGTPASVNASVGHEAVEIDISGGYTSDTISLEWEEETSFQFEVTVENANYTFEILDIETSLFSYIFEHEGEHDDYILGLSDGTDLHGNLTDDNLPFGSHLEVKVVRHLKNMELGNYTLEFNNGHEHPSDPVEFSFKFTEGNIGEEILGEVENGEVSDEDDSNGFEFLVLLGLFPMYKISKKKKF